MLSKKRLECVLIFFCVLAVVFMILFPIAAACRAISPKIAAITISAVLTTGVSFFHNYLF